jgi:hypothetical protein
MNKAFTHLILRHFEINAVNAIKTLMVLTSVLIGMTAFAAPSKAPAKQSKQSTNNYLCEEVQTDGEWLFHVRGPNGHLGKTDLNGYFVTKQECQASLKKIANSQICLYAGGWQRYSIIKDIFGGAKMKTQEECIAKVLETKDFELCDKNGNGFFPIVFEKTIYFKSNTSCEQAASSAIDGKLCVANRVGGYSIYKILEDKWLEPAFTYPTIESCSKKVAFPIQNYKVDKSKLTQPFLSGPNTEIGFTLKQCRDPQRKDHIVKNDNGVLDKDCFPDTYYSWGDYKKLQLYSENLNNETWAGTFGRPLFMTQSPVATFGYGPIAMRIKIKKTVKAKLIFKRQANKKLCEYLEPSEVDNTILVIQWSNYSGSGLDYILCSGGPVESWSYGTKTHYDEIVRDITWINTNKSDNYQAYFLDTRNLPEIFGSNLDGKVFSKQRLADALAYHRSLVENKLGQIFYAPGEVKNHKRHFHTRMPIYYNW